MALPRSWPVGRCALALLTFAAAAFAGPQPAQAGYPETVNATPGVLGYWRLDESSGATAVDQRGLANGSYRGAVTLGQPSALSAGGTSALFDAKSEYLTIPHRPAYNVDGFTVEAWIYLIGYGDTTKTRRIASKGSSTSQRAWLLALAPNTQGRIHYSVGGAIYSAATTTTNLALGRWYHLAYVHLPKDRLRMYVNGAIAGEVKTPAVPALNTSPVLLAGDGSDSGAFARYDEFAYYNRALTLDEVRRHYSEASGAADTTPPETTIGSGPSGPTSNPAPAFGFSSNESGSSFECRLGTSAPWTTCTSPYRPLLLADGPYTVQVRARDAAGNVDPTPASAAFTLDTLIPDTSVVSGPDPLTNDRSPSFSFGASETPVTYQCRVDSGAWTSCGSSWTAPALGDGPHEVAVRAVDAAGNTDASPATHAFSIDSTAPDTAIDWAPQAVTRDPAVAIRFSSSETGARFECRFDASPWAPCSSPFSPLALTDGAHSFEARAIDAAGNVDATPATASFTLDTLAPETSVDPAAATLLSDPTPAFSFGSEPGATFECSLDSGAWEGCDSPWTLPAQLDGAHTLAVRATDAAGNVDPTPASHAFTIDTVTPETDLDDGPSGVVTSDSARFEFSSPDPTAGFECSMDAGAWAACDSPLDLSDLSEGDHSFAVRAVDPAGNTDGTPASRQWSVDASVPDTSIDDGPEGLSRDATPTFRFSATEDASLSCRLDGGDWFDCASPLTLGPLGDGDHSFDVKATDGAGNEDGTPASRSFTVDASAPETSLDSAPSGTLTSGSATLEFSSPDASATFECSLDDADWADCDSPRELTGLGEGRRSFAVRAVDPAGNVDPTPESATWIVDASLPDTSIDDGPSGTTVNPTPSFRFSATESATFRCRVDDGDWEDCSSPRTLPALELGQHSFDVKAVDEAGNEDESPARREFTLDHLAPDTTIESGPGSVPGTAEFSFSSTDPDATFECSLDDADWDDCASPVTYSGLGDGPHSFRARAVDSAGNRDDTPASVEWGAADDYGALVGGEPGLISHWRLGEAEGAAAADAAGPNDGSYEGGVGLGRPDAIRGDPDPAVVLDGVDDRVTIPHHDSLNTAHVSIEAWVKPSDVSPGHVQTVAEKPGQYRLGLDGRAVSFELTTTREGAVTAVSYDGGDDVDTGWQHLAATFDGYNAHVFVDGVRVAKKRVVPETIADPANNPSVLAAGSEPLVLGGGGNPFEGSLDEVAVYDRDLTPLEAEAHYRSGSGDRGDPAVCRERFGSFDVGNWPPGCWRPYADTSPLNRRIPSDPPLDPLSEQMVSTLMSWNPGSLQGKPSRLTNYRPGYSDWTHPTYYSRPDDPEFEVTCSKKTSTLWNDCALEGLKIRIPAEAKPASAPFYPGNDHHMAVIDQRTGWEYDFYGAATPANGKLTIKWGEMVPVNGDGLKSGATASELANLAGPIRAQELAAGEIRHALFMVVNCVHTDDVGPVEAVYPAFGDAQPCSKLNRDGTYAPRAGNRFYLDISDQELAAITPAYRRTVFRAMRDYGMIVGDTGGGGYSWAVQLESDATYNSFTGYPQGQMELFGRANGWAIGTSAILGEIRQTYDFWATRLKVVHTCVSRGDCP